MSFVQKYLFAPCFYKFQQKRHHDCIKTSSFNVVYRKKFFLTARYDLDLESCEASVVEVSRGPQ